MGHRKGESPVKSTPSRWTHEDWPGHTALSQQRYRAGWMNHAWAPTQRSVSQPCREVKCCHMLYSSPKDMVLRGEARHTGDEGE